MVLSCLFVNCNFSEQQQNKTWPHHTPALVIFMRGVLTQEQRARRGLLIVFLCSKMCSWQIVTQWKCLTAVLRISGRGTKWKWLVKKQTKKDVILLVPGFSDKFCGESSRINLVATGANLPQIPPFLIPLLSITLPLFHLCIRIMDNHSVGLQKSIHVCVQYKQRVCISQELTSASVCLAYGVCNPLLNVLTYQRSVSSEWVDKSVYVLTWLAK